MTPIYSVCIYLLMVSKYDGLGTYLRSQAGDRIAMTFEEIEQVTATKLPENKGRGGTAEMLAGPRMPPGSYQARLTVAFDVVPER